MVRVNQFALLAKEKEDYVINILSNYNFREA
jgi:hypothetical protein